MWQQAESYPDPRVEIIDDRFAEMVLDGKPAAEAMPLVQDHLDRCGDCHEEFDALLAALRAMS